MPQKPKYKKILISKDSSQNEPQMDLFFKTLFLKHYSQYDWFPSNSLIKLQRYSEMKTGYAVK